MCVCKNCYRIFCISKSRFIKVLQIIWNINITYIFKLSYERQERHPALSPPSFSSALRLGPPIKMIPHPPAASKASRLEGPASRYDRGQNEPPRYSPSRFVLLKEILQ